MQQALWNVHEEVQQAVWSGTPRYGQWHKGHVALKVDIPELNELVRVFHGFRYYVTVVKVRVLG